MDKLSDHIARLREDFMSGVLSEGEADALPMRQFRRWLQQAVEAQVPEVQAMSLATVSATGRPSSRIVYLREFDEHDHYTFYTNYNSRKALELSSNPYAALTFFWPALERQVRIEGRVSKVPTAQSDAYYDARPYESKLGAWASAQSERLTSRQDLERALEEQRLRWTPETIVRPDFWGGFVLQADHYEFWQGRKSRLHDRITYELDKGMWRMGRLSP